MKINQKKFFFKFSYFSCCWSAHRRIEGKSCVLEGPIGIDFVKIFEKKKIGNFGDFVNGLEDTKQQNCDLLLI